MFRSLVSSIGRGRCHVVEAADTARAALAEGASSAGVAGLAPLVAGGAHAANSERDLYRWLDLGRQMHLEPYILYVARDVRSTMGTQLHPTPVLPVHEIFHAIWHAGPQQWAVSMLGPGAGW